MQSNVSTEVIIKYVFIFKHKKYNEMNMQISYLIHFYTHIDKETKTELLKQHLKLTK